jgi:hypothetical protein
LFIIRNLRFEDKKKDPSNAQVLSDQYGPCDGKE